MSNTAALFKQGFLTAPQAISVYNAHAQRLIHANRFEAAISYLDQALALMPDHSISHWNKGMALLALGDYRRGFKEFQFRLQWKYVNPRYGDANLPHWQGEDLRGKSLLWCQEHGFGDGIMMLRFIPRLQQLGAQVTVLTCPEMARLFEVPVLTAWNGERFDFKMAMFSIMARLDIGLADIPNAPYLIPDPELVRKWRARLPRERHKVGIAWSGLRTYTHDQQRSIKLPEFLSLLDARDCDLYSVQNSEHELANACGVTAHHFEDFADTLAFMACMDSVVTVATAASMLAGAMGHHDAHVVVPHHPDWRFWHSYAWFPTLNVHRQREAGDWRSAFEQIDRAGFDPSQPRDDEGQWTSGGAGSAGKGDHDDGHDHTKIGPAVAKHKTLQSKTLGKVSAAESQAMEFYQGNHRAINDPLRYGDAGSAKAGRHVEALDAMFERTKLAEPVVVFRQMDEWALKQFTSKGVGKVFSDNGFMSTSMRREVAAHYGFGGARVQVEISLPKGAKAAPIGAGSKKFLTQTEILIQRGARFKITSIDKKARVVRLQYVK